MAHTSDPTYFFEDLNINDTIALGTEQFTKAEILSFAEKYDPQWFHLDEEAATESVFGGLVASGLQTVCLCNRMATEEFYSDSALVGGNRLKIKFPRPVWPGDEISFAMEVVNKEDREDYPDHGKVTLWLTGRNQDEEFVLEWLNNVFFKRRTD